MTDKQLVVLFRRYGVWEYIYSCCEALHTMGTNYVIQNIDQYIQAQFVPVSDLPIALNYIL